jgi:hypothetical protein
LVGDAASRDFIARDADISRGSPWSRTTMMKLTVVLAVIAVVLFLAFRLLFGGQTDSWHQRLTVAVETPAGEVSGSAVTEVTFVDYSGPMALPEASGPRGTVRGEAVAVEVLPGKWLFALLDGAENPEGAAKSWSFATYAPKRDANNISRNFWDRVADIHDQPYDTPVPIPPESWPLMVTFADIADPTSVARVDPNDLAASFGPGVRLKAVTLEITRAEVTEGRMEQFPFWPKLISQVTFSSLHFFDQSRPDPLNYLTIKTMKMGDM